MTKEETDYCEICDMHDCCAYASRGMRRKCLRLAIFADGFDAAINKVIMWLCELTPEQLSDVDFDDFKKAMYK